MNQRKNPSLCRSRWLSLLLQDIFLNQLHSFWLHHYNPLKLWILELCAISWPYDHKYTHTYLQNNVLSCRLPYIPTLFAIRSLREMSCSFMPTLHPFLVGITSDYTQAGLSDWMFLNDMIGKLILKACSSSELRYQYRHLTKPKWFQSHCFHG